jgi:preprotein translocase subunit SecB
LTVSLDSVRSEAARVAACVDLRDIRVFELNAELNIVPDDDETKLSYTFNSDLQVQYDADQKLLIVFGTYALAVTARSIAPQSEVEDLEVDDPAEVATVNFNLNALFEVERTPDEEAFTQSELEAFGQTTGQFALYPYARELVSDVTGRMGLPALHMGVMRLHLDSRTGD